MESRTTLEKYRYGGISTYIVGYLSMDYQTKNVQNYDISNYNELFKDYVNENTTKVANDMKNLKLPVLGVQKVIMVRKCSIQCITKFTRQDNMF